MSASKAKDVSERSFDLTGPWAGAWRIFAGVGVLGLAAAGFGYTVDPRRFAFSWMFAFITVLTVALGCLFFVLVNRVSSAGWSVTVRRTAEFFGYGVLALIPMFIPVLLTMGYLFPWLGEHKGGHAEGAEHASISLVTPAYAQAPEKNPHPTAGGEHGTPVQPGAVAEPAGKLPGAATGVPRDMPMPPSGAGLHGEHAVAGHAGNPHVHEEHEVLAKKNAYLNRNSFLIRMFVYFLVWGIIAVRLFSWSTAEDRKKDPRFTVLAQRFSAPALVLYGLTLTFAAFDWVMSLEPLWFSTIFGVVIFATGVVSSLAVIILATLALRSSGPLDGVVTVEHYHDLGKLLFGFLVFWGYVSFAQLLLIWYAALPEETTFFHNRWDYAPWDRVSIALIVFNFVVPFFWLMSRWFKRNLGRLQIGAAMLLVMHVVEIYWYVMPNYHLGAEGFTFHWLDIACLVAVGGLYCAFVFHRMTQHPLIPIGDPRLQRALHFQNA